MFQVGRICEETRMRDSSTHLRTIANQDGAVILNSVAGTITTLNSTGAFVWQGLERGEDVDTIAQNLARETGEEVTAIRYDLLEFVACMEKAKLSSYSCGGGAVAHTHAGSPKGDLDEASRF
jgi:3-phosphoglycerate kinase